MNKNKTTLFKNLLTTASALTLIMSSANSALGEAIARETTADPVDLSVGTNLNGGGAFISGSTLKIAGIHNVDANIAPLNILAINVNVGGALLTASKNVKIGSIVDAANGGNQMNIAINNGLTLTLTGSSGGVLIPAINVANIYEGLNQIDFTNNGGFLTIESADANSITLKSAFANAAHGTLNVNTNLIVKDITAATINEINVEDGKSLTFDIGNNNLNILAGGAKIGFAGEDSSLVFKVNGNNKTVTFNDNLTSGGDDAGRLEFHSTDGAASLLTITGNGGVKTLGTDNANRLKELVLSGDKGIEFTDQINVFAKKITVNGDVAVEFVNELDSGVGSEMIFTADNGEVTLTNGGTIEKIDFNGNNGASVHIANANTLTIGGETFVGLNLNNQIKFGGADSQLKVQATEGNQVTLMLTSDIDQNNNEGILTFHASGNDGGVGPIHSKLTIGGAHKIGKGAAKLKQINIEGDGNTQVTLNHGTKIYTNKLVVDQDAKFIAKDMSVAGIAAIEIGTGVGAGFLTIDGTGAVNAGNGGAGANFNVNLLANAATDIKFNHANSELTLSNSSANNNSLTFTLQDNLDPGANEGALVLNNTGAGDLIITANGNKTLGTGGNNLKQLRVIGNNNVIVRGSAANGVDLTNIEVLNVQNGAKLIDESATSLDIANVNIGEAGGAGRLTVDLKNVDATLIAGGNVIDFKHANSVFVVRNTGVGNKTFTLARDFDPAGAGVAGGNGILEFSSIDAANALGITANVAEALGTVGNKFKEINITNGKVVFAQNMPVNAVTLNVKNGELVTKNAAIGAIKNITIGEAGPATLTINAANGNVNLITNVANSIKFVHNDSVLKLVSNGNKTFTIQNDAIGGGTAGAPLDLNGIVELNAVVGALTLDCAGAGNTLGRPAANRLKELRITGNKAVTLNPAVFAEKIVLKGTGEITAATLLIGDVSFTAAQTLKANAGITGNVALSNGGTVEIKGAPLTGSVTSAGANGELHAFNGITGSVDLTNGGKVASTTIGNGVKLDNGAQIIAANAITGNVVFGANAGAELTAAAGITGNVTFANAGDILNVEGVIGGNVDALGGARGELNFTGVGSVTGTIGATNALTLVHFNGAGVAIGLRGNAKATDFTFGAADIVTAAGTITGDVDFANQDGTLNANGLITGNIDSNGGVNGTLNFTGVGSVTGTIGATNALKVIQINNGATTTLSDAIVKATEIKIGEVAGAGTLVRGGDVDFDINNGVNTKVTFVHADSNLKLRNTDGGANHTITLHGNLVGVGDDEGRVWLTSSGAGKQLIIDQNVAETIGASNVNRIKELVIDGAEATVINPEVFAKKLTLGGAGSVSFVDGLHQGTGGIIDVNHNVTIHGDLSGINTNINLHDKELTYNKGTATLTGDIVINTTIKAGGAGIGQIIVDANGGPTILDIDGATKITINLNGTSSLADVGKSYPIFKIVNGGVITFGGPDATLTSHDTKALGWVSSAAGTLSNPVPVVVGGGGIVGGGIPFTSSGVPVGGSSTAIPKDLLKTENLSQVLMTLNDNNDNSYARYELDSKGEAVLTSKLKEGLEKDFGVTNPGIVKSFADIDTTKDTDAREVANELGTLATQNRVVQQDAANRLSVTAPTEAIVNITHVAAQAAETAVNSRINNISLISQTAIKVSEAYGVAAGDDNLSQIYGIWGSPFYSQSTQKKKGNAPGYKGKSGGGSIGFDCLINDDLTLGAAVTFISTKLNHKDQKNGDTTKAESTLFSIYGLQELPNNWFAQGIVSFGSSKIRNYEKRIINLNLNQTANGKYSSTMYSGEVLGGHRFVLSDERSVLTPMLGLRYGKFNDGGYTETGTNRRNLTVTKKSIDKIEGVIGARASTSALFNESLLMSEVHGFVNYDFKGKTPKVEARLNGALAPMPAKTSKPTKTFVNLGASATVKYYMMEYGLGYDAYLAKKYIGHQGSLKVRVNF